jgi:N utilization substance protein B
MGKRREGREAAMQLMFAHDVQGEVSEQDMSTFWDLHTARPGVRENAERLVKGIQEHQVEIDALITGTLENFSFARLGTVDRNILRLAIYEMIHLPEVPRPVAINEAIEIAKTFGDTQTKNFVNGVLDKISRALPKRERKPKAEAEAEAIKEPNLDTETKAESLNS